MPEVVRYGGCTYEIEAAPKGARVYRRIGSNEYLSWYIGDERIERRGEIRRLFLFSAESKEAAFRQLFSA